MAPIDKSGDGGSTGDIQVKTEPKLDETVEKGADDNQAETAKAAPVAEIKTEPITPAKVKTEAVTPAKSNSVAVGATDAAGEGKNVTKTETSGETTGVKTEADSVLGLDVLVDDTMINDLDADLINTQGKTSAGTTDEKAKDDKQPDAEGAPAKTANAEDGMAKDDKTTTGDDKGDKKAETSADEKKSDGDDKSKRLVGFVCSLSLDSSVDYHVD